jgi:hypothetical protein
MELVPDRRKDQFVKGILRPTKTIALLIRNRDKDVNQKFDRIEKHSLTEDGMNETFERVTERRGKVEVPIKHLYRRQYQTADGNWSTIYYAIFTDWKGKRRKFAVWSQLEAAKDGLAIYLAIM